MRAIYLLFEDVKEGQTLEISEKDSLHHLKNVLRTQVGEELLLLDGLGRKAFSEISVISKKSIHVNIKKIVNNEINIVSTLYLCIPKKEAFDLCLRQSVELGISNIILLNSKYSQRYKLNNDRIKKVLINALEQSNNPYLPEIKGLVDYGSLSEGELKEIIYFSVKKYECNIKKIHKEFKFLIGPEGGLSEDEESKLNENKAIHLETAILRTPTALACAYGHLLALQNI